eukprot:5405236-Pyramimonas_sp.AAC.1
MDSVFVERAKGLVSAEFASLCVAKEAEAALNGLCNPAPAGETLHSFVTVPAAGWDRCPPPPLLYPPPPPPRYDDIFNWELDG